MDAAVECLVAFPELGDDHGAALASRQGERFGEARAPVEGVRALVGLDLDELT